VAIVELLGSAEHHQALPAEVPAAAIGSITCYVVAPIILLDGLCTGRAWLDAKPGVIAHGLLDCCASLLIKVHAKTCVRRITTTLAKAVSVGALWTIA
jgi:hypothetical protein